MAEILITIPEGLSDRLDKALAAAAPEEAALSRSRLTRLIAEGAVTGPSGRVRDGKARAEPGDYRIAVGEPEALDAQPENIPLNIAYEDADLIVVDKPAGMVVHPAPGAPSGTLVNALLWHCADSLSGIGGAARPGIVHRIDKDTSGLLVVAKTDRAHQGLASQFADHSASRRYLAIGRAQGCNPWPAPAWPGSSSRLPAKSASCAWCQPLLSGKTYCSLRQSCMTSSAPALQSG